MVPVSGTAKDVREPRVRLGQVPHAGQQTSEFRTEHLGPGPGLGAEEDALVARPPWRVGCLCLLKGRMGSQRLSGPSTGQEQRLWRPVSLT